MADLGDIAGGAEDSALEGAQGTGKPGGPPPNIQQLVASKRLQQAQAQVGEVVDIMRVNVEKVLERDQKISELDRRADDLQEGASQFQQQAVKLKRKYWWENIKMWLIIGVVLMVIIIIVVVSTTGQGTGSPTATVTVESGSEGSSPTENGGNDTASPGNGGTNGEDVGGGSKSQPSAQNN